MEERLRAVGQRLAKNRHNTAVAYDDACEAAYEALDAGLSQRRIAELLGVDRMTVRKWIVKR